MIFHDICLNQPELLTYSASEDIILQDRELNALARHRHLLPCTKQSDRSSQYLHREDDSVFPVGLSKYREGLYPLEPLTKEDAENALDIIGRFQNEMYERFGTHFVHASDEFYLLANRPLPPEEVYDGYVQLENGVGMLRLLIEETDYALVRFSRISFVANRNSSSVFSKVD